jgi:hypothetical protein
MYKTRDRAKFLHTLQNFFHPEFRTGQGHADVGYRHPKHLRDFGVALLEVVSAAKQFTVSRRQAIQSFLDHFPAFDIHQSRIVQWDIGKVLCFQSQVSPVIVGKIAGNFSDVTREARLSSPLPKTPEVIFPDVKEETLKQFVRIFRAQIKVADEYRVNELPIFGNKLFEGALAASKHAADEQPVVLKRHCPAACFVSRRHTPGQWR